MAVRDPKTEWLRVKIYRGMTPQRRMQLALELMDTAQSAASASIKAMQPGIGGMELQRALRWRMTPIRLRYWRGSRVPRSRRTEKERKSNLPHLFP